MKIELKYGRKTRLLDSEILGDYEILAAKEQEPADEEQLIREALEHPIASPRLRELAGPEDRVCVIVSDISRAYQKMSLFLPHVLAELEEAGVKREHITLLCALGAHAPQSEEEKRLVLGDLYGKYRFVEHDCRDKENLAHLGESRHGTPICVSRYAAEADKVILTGAVTYHDMAGFGGGRKSVMPGIASYEAVSANHLQVFAKELGKGLNPDCRLGNLAGNPMHEDMVDACGLLRPAFLFNVVLDGNNRYYKAVAGDWEQAFLQGTRYCQEACSVPISKKADIAIACCGGYPKDMNLYQASKGYATGIDAVKPGGVVILMAQCEDGMGAAGSVSIITDFTDHLEREKKMRQVFEPEAYSGYYICEMARRYHLYLVSDYEPAAELSGSGVELFSSLEEAVSRARQEMDEDAFTYVIPSAMSIVTEYIKE